MCVTGNLLLLLLMAAPEPVSLANIPVVDRQATNFYGAIATGRDNVTAEWSVTPPSAPRDQEITLTLIIRSAANPRELTRPDLKTRSDFTKHFQIDDLPDLTPVDGVARFAYRLRPREAGSFTLPALAYRFYRPRFPEGRRFQTTYARLKEPIIVTEPATKSDVAVVPLSAPESFFTLMPESSARELPLWAGLVPILLAPVATLWGLRFWRRCFPDAAQLAQARRHRAARLALRQLQRLRTHADSAPAVVAILRTYLQARHGLPTQAATPSEIAAGLRTLGILPASCADAERLFRRCDSACFRPHSDNALSLVDEAMAWVVSWEGGTA